MTGDQVRFGWHSDSHDGTLASLRYRMIEPLRALQDRGVPIDVHDPRRAPESYDAIIFCKSQSGDAVTKARVARAAGKAVIYDMCDNLFAAHQAGHVGAARLGRVREMLGLATHLTFSTETLRRQIAAEVPGLTDRQWVVPDVIVADSVLSKDAMSIAERWELGRLERFLARHERALHCVWFGKSLGRVAGYAHLRTAFAELRRFARTAPVTLTVISNDRLRFWTSVPRGGPPVHYMPWRLATAPAALAMHRVAVIPVEHNAYTAGKTLNRPATAILAGLGVVADAIPSYEELRPFIALGDWQGGLERYRCWSPDTERDLAAARLMLVEHYSRDAVAGHWMRVLDTVDTPPRG